MYRARVLVALSVISLGLAAAAPANADESARIAVLVTGATPQDRELAESLNEVVIGRIAATSGGEISGVEELRAQMNFQTDAEVSACIGDHRCLGRGAVVLGARYLMSGTLSRVGPECWFSLEWQDLLSEAPPRRVYEKVRADLKELARAAQRSVDTLMRSPVSKAKFSITGLPDTQIWLNEVPVGTAPLTLELASGPQQLRLEAEGRFSWRRRIELEPGTAERLNITEREMPVRKAWPATAMWTGVALTGVALSSAALFGVLSRRPPRGDTRGEVQRDLEDLQRDATIANVSLAAAGVAGVATGLVVVIHWDHILGRSPVLEIR
jgi:hypothetical protein